MPLVVGKIVKFSKNLKNLNYFCVPDYWMFRWVYITYGLEPTFRQFFDYSMHEAVGQKKTD